MPNQEFGDGGVIDKEMQQSDKEEGKEEVNLESIQLTGNLPSDQLLRVSLVILRWQTCQILA